MIPQVLQPNVLQQESADDTPVLELRVLSLEEILSQSIPSREYLLAPWLLCDTLNLIHAKPGVGKSFFAMQVAMSVAGGLPFVDWTAPKARKVLYIDGEMSRITVQQRLQAFVQASQSIECLENFRMLSIGFQNRSIPSLASKEGQSQITELSKDADLIVVDNISCLVRGAGNENDAESWDLVQNWAIGMRASGKSVLFIHHSGKSGTQRGTSKREDAMDVILTFKKSSGSFDGLSFELHFEKSRDIYGEAIEPLELSLTTESARGFIWNSKPLHQSTYNKVHQLNQEGLSRKEIGKKLGVDKSTVSRHLTKGSKGRNA